MGDGDATKEVKTFLPNVIYNIVNRIPVVGHLKGLYHYRNEDFEEYRKAMNASNHTLLVGIVGAFVQLCSCSNFVTVFESIVVGRLVDAYISKKKNDGKDYRDYKLLVLVSNTRANLEIWFDLIISIALDGFVGYFAGRFTFDLLSKMALEVPWDLLFLGTCTASPERNNIDTCLYIVLKDVVFLVGGYKQQKYSASVEMKIQDILWKKRWFYKVQLPFGMECIIPRRLEEIYSKTMEKHANVNQEESDSGYVLMEDFIRMNSSKQTLTPKELLELLEKYLESPVGEEHLIYCYWLLDDLDSRYLPDLTKCLKRAISMRKKKIAKAIAWRLTNIFSANSKWYFSFRSAHAVMWPEIRSEYQGMDTFMIIVVTDKIIENFPSVFECFSVQRFSLNNNAPNLEYWTAKERWNRTFISGDAIERLLGRLFLMHN